MTIRSYIEQIQYPGKVSKRNLHAGSSSIHAATLASIDCVAVSCDFFIPEAVNNIHYHGATCAWSLILTHAPSSIPLISAEVLFIIRVVQMQNVMVQYHIHTETTKWIFCRMTNSYAVDKYFQFQ